MATPAAASVPAERSAVELAGTGRRLAALVYETLLAITIVFLAGVVALPLSLLADPALTRPLFRACALVALALYFVHCWSHGGQTLPMKTWRLRIVTADGRPLRRRDAWRRFVLAVPCVALGGAGYVWALFDRERQFLHDRLAGTRIVKVEGTGLRD